MAAGTIPGTVLGITVLTTTMAGMADSTIPGSMILGSTILGIMADGTVAGMIPGTIADGTADIPGTITAGDTSITGATSALAEATGLTGPGSQLPGPQPGAASVRCPGQQVRGVPR